MKKKPKCTLTTTLSLFDGGEVHWSGNGTGSCSVPEAVCIAHAGMRRLIRFAEDIGAAEGVEPAVVRDMIRQAGETCTVMEDSITVITRHKENH